MAAVPDPAVSSAAVALALGRLDRTWAAVRLIEYAPYREIVGRLEAAQGNAAGLFPADVARVLLTVTEDDWHLVRWSEAPHSDRFITDARALGERLLLVG